MDQDLVFYFAAMEVLQGGCRLVNLGSHASQRGRYEVLTKQAIVNNSCFIQTLTTVFGNGFPVICVSELSCAAVTVNLCEFGNTRISEINSPMFV